MLRERDPGSPGQGPGPCNGATCPSAGNVQSFKMYRCVLNCGLLVESPTLSGRPSQ